VNLVFSLHALAAQILLHLQNFSRCGAAQKPVVGYPRIVQLLSVRLSLYPIQ